jgi:hypothetical protein
VYQSLREWFTAVVQLSGTSIVVTPPKYSYMWTCALIQFFVFSSVNAST